MNCTVCLICILLSINGCLTFARYLLTELALKVDMAINLHVRRKDGLDE